MTRRVNIQYSVKIDELQSEVSRLVNRALTDLQCIISEHDVGSNVTLTMDTHSDVDSIRIALADVDSILHDVNNIIRSYVAYKTQEVSQDMIPNVPQAQAPSTPEDAIAQLGNLGAMEDLQQKISSFKENLDKLDGVSENVSNSR
jgi:hypothetical protein